LKLKNHKKNFYINRDISAFFPLGNNQAYLDTQTLARNSCISPSVRPSRSASWKLFILVDRRNTNDVQFRNKGRGTWKWRRHTLSKRR